MATYTSTQDGNWTADATWGGGGHPSVNGDIANIGHDVTFDGGIDAITYNDVTITSGGVLIFPINQNSEINFDATAVLTVESGGELRAGTSGSPIGSSYNCDIKFPQGTVNRDVFVIDDGGTLNIYGDSDFYGGERWANIRDNWSSGQTFYLRGDYSSAWQTGQRFAIARYNSSHTGYTNGVYNFTIATVGAYEAGLNRTPITINEAAPGVTFYDWAPVVMLSRNINLINTNATYTMYAYNAAVERIYFSCNQQIPNDNVNVHEAQFLGWERNDFGQGSTVHNVVFVNCTSSIYGTVACTIQCDIYSCMYGVYNIRECKINNSSFFMLQRTFSTAHFSTFTDCMFTENRFLVYGSNYHNKLIGCDLFNFSTMLSNANITEFENCQLDYYTKNAPATVGISLSSTVMKVLFSRCFIPSGGFNITNRNSGATSTRVAYDESPAGDNLIDYNFGQAIKTACDGTGTSPSEDPDGGSDHCVELSNLQTRLCEYTPVHALEYEANKYWKPVDTHTITIKVQSSWGITTGGIVLNVKYHGIDPVLGRSDVLLYASDAPAITARTGADDWSQELEVTVTTTVEDWIDIELYLIEYQAGGYVYVWPEPVWS